MSEFASGGIKFKPDDPLEGMADGDDVKRQWAGGGKVSCLGKTRVCAERARVWCVYVSE